MSALVLGAGSSQRLGQPKQLLEYRGRPLLQAAVNNALAAPVEQVIVAIGGAAPEVKATVDFGWADIVENTEHATGCSSSIVAALAAVDDRAEGLVLLLGDQPGVDYATIAHLVQSMNETSASQDLLAVCRYDDGLGHPFWFGREIFSELRQLQGDKAVWKLLESGSHEVHEVKRGGKIPLDVDTWNDYEALLEQTPPGPLEVI